MIGLDDPNIYVLFALTTFIFAGGILVSMAFDADSSPSDCVLEGAAHASNNEVVETAVIQEDADDEDDDDSDTEDDDDEDSDEEPDTDEEDRIVGRKVNRLLLDTIDTLLDIRKAREERAAKRLKVE